MSDAPLPEVWLRGPVPDVPPLLQPAAHALLQCREELHRVLAGLVGPDLAIRVHGAAPIAFHVRHAAGSLDRLYTYARGEELSAEQAAALVAERRGEQAGVDELLTLFDDAVDRALAQLRATPESVLLDPRPVGRKKLPSTVLGLLFHGAEHTQRHVGQVATTAMMVRGAARAPRSRSYSLSEAVRQVLAGAREEAGRLGHEYVGTEHLALALMAGTRGLAAAILSSVDVPAMSEELKRRVGYGPRPIGIGVELSYTSKAKRVLELATTQAVEFEDEIVDTEHLLLGLLREGDGPGGRMLRDFGFSVEAVRERVFRERGDRVEG